LAARSRPVVVELEMTNSTAIPAAPAWAWISRASDDRSWISPTLTPWSQIRRRNPLGGRGGMMPVKRIHGAATGRRPDHRRQAIQGRSATKAMR
jgi:hypothetical protein